MIEEEKTTGELLFMEDVEKYDSFLRKSTYLDSPQPPEAAITRNIQDRRETAGFGARDENHNYPQQQTNQQSYFNNPSLIDNNLYEESSQIDAKSDDIMSDDSMNVYGKHLSHHDFSISFMKSQTEYFHRFIRCKNVDPDRFVLLENAVERYLVDLEKESDNPHRSNFSLFKQNFQERVIYNTL